jgi:hypothetical protein
MWLAAVRLRIITQRPTLLSSPPLVVDVVIIFMPSSASSFIVINNHVERRGTNQLRLLERYLDVLVKHTTEIPPPTALVEGTASSALVESVSLR